MRVAIETITTTPTCNTLTGHLKEGRRKLKMGLWKRLKKKPMGALNHKLKERRHDMEYCHYDYEDEEHDCLDYMECEECPYYYAD